MKKFYLPLAGATSILCLISQSTFVLAKTSQPATVNSKLIVTRETMSAVSLTVPEAKNSVIQVVEPTPATTPPIVLTGSKVVPQEQTLSINSFEDQVTSVSQLSDVQPTDWAFQSLQSLIKHYGLTALSPDSAYRGNRALTRYEFAAGINAVLERMRELIASGLETQVSRKDLLTLQRLQEEFAPELTTLQEHVNSLETRTAQLKANQFSTTTKLTGLIISAVSAGGFSGHNIIDPRGAKIANGNPNTTFTYRASLNLTTSFSGTDLLLVRLEQGSGGARKNASGYLEPNFGSVLDFSLRSAGEQLQLARLQYTFKPFKNFIVILGPTLTPQDYLDRNSYANLSYIDFSTLALINNFILFPIEDLGAGAVIEWNPRSGPFTVRAGYVAPHAAAPNPSKQSSAASGSLLVNLLYPSGNSNNGLFGHPNQTTVELEYAPSKAFALRLQYSGGDVFNNRRFDVLGVNFELALSPKIGIFGRYGYGSYSGTTFGDINPNYWMAGVAFRDLFKSGALAGIATGQPFIERAVGNATQTNFEAFYNLPLNNNIRLTPVIQVITNPANQESNGTIFTGTLRTSITF